MTVVEMDEMNLERLERNHLYGETRSEAISEIVRVLANDLEQEREKISLSDANAVKRVTNEYLDSCRRVGILPSKTGLCRALGYSCSGVARFMREHCGHQTEDYLSRAFDAFAEAFDIAALGGNVHPIYAIFVQKSIYGRRDNSPVEQPVNNPLGELTPTEDIARKYADILGVST